MFCNGKPTVNHSNVTVEKKMYSVTVSTQCALNSILYTNFFSLMKYSILKRLKQKVVLFHIRGLEQNTSTPDSILTCY